MRTLGFLGGLPVELHKWSVGVPWLGIGCGSRVPVGSCDLSHVCSRIYHSSSRIPQPRCLIVGPICPCGMAKVNRVQMEVGMPRLKRSAFRHHLSGRVSHVDLEYIRTMLQQENREHFQRPTCSQDPPCFQIHCTVHTPRKGPL